MHRKKVLLHICIVLLIASLCSCAPDLKIKRSLFLPENVGPTVADEGVECKHEIKTYDILFQDNRHILYCRDSQHIGCNKVWIEEHDFVHVKVYGNYFAHPYDGRCYHKILVRCSVCHISTESTTDFLLCSKGGIGCNGDCENAIAYTAILEKKKEE